MTFILFESLRPNLQESQTFVVKEPETILQCRSLHEVKDVLQEVQKYTNRGWTAFGFLTYESGYAFLPNLPEPKISRLPLVWFALSKTFENKLPNGFFPSANQPEVQGLKLSQNLSSYSETLNTIKRLIQEGDTYQVNYTLRYNGVYSGSARNLYAWLRQQQRVNYAALIETSEWAISSFSPELFVRRDQKEVLMRPMKGTAPRGRTLEEDVRNASELKTSAKERSENLMIVDMLRSDLGKICEPGSVRVTVPMEVEQYETLLQMTSTITGHLNSGIEIPDLIQATFPSGSITGAPKIRTMQIIHELEKRPRGIYTGSIGWWSTSQCVFSVAIRTLFLDRSNNNLEMGVGSGILFEADAEHEYQECELKAKFLIESKQRFYLFETIRWENESGFSRLPFHLDRLERSAQYFLFDFNREAAEKKLHEKADELSEIFQARIRMQLNEFGEVEIEWHEIEEWPVPARILLSESRTNSNDRFLYHKTTERRLYETEHAAAKKLGYVDVIFRNERDEITEGAISNIFIEKDGTFFTPPVQSGLLAGTFRRFVLESGQWMAEEKILKLEDLRSADRIYLTNAIRGMIPVTLE